MEQATKFCFKCGAKIPGDAVFCPKCGTSQPTEQVPVQKQETNEPYQNVQQPQPQPNVQQFAINAPIPPTNMGGLNRDLKPERILAYKKAMGFPASIDNVLYIQNNYTKKMLLLGVLAVLSNKMMLASFEDQGILFCGYDLNTHFNGVNTFIPNNEIEEIHLITGVIQNKLKITTTHERLNFLSPRFLAFASYQKQNMHRLMSEFH